MCVCGVVYRVSACIQGIIKMSVVPGERYDEEGVEVEPVDVGLYRLHTVGGMEGF